MSVIHLMLERGGDVRRGQLLPYCVFREENVNDVLSLLVEKGAPLNETMSSDRLTLVSFWSRSLGTALHAAVELGKLDVIRHLVKLGADVDAKDAHGRSVLEFAKFCKQEDAVIFLENLSQNN